MQTGPFTSTQPQQPAGGGRGAALLVGGISFAIVFLLIVGGTVAFLVFRPGGTGGRDDGTTSPRTSPASPSTSESASLKPYTDGEYCWRPSAKRTSTNPSGRLRGGGLEVVPPDIYDARTNYSMYAFTNDVQVAAAPVEKSWASTLTVGKVEWEDGYEYPGAEIASKRILDCTYSNSSNWGDTSQRSLVDEITEPVTIAGMPGYRSSATVKFGKHNLTKTDSTLMVVVVLETPDGPSLFASDTSAGVTEHEKAAEEAYASLTGLSG